MWTVVNERDELGSDLVPDYLTSVKDGGFYGWPYSHYGSHVDDRVKPSRPDLVSNALVPDYALGAHVAPLGHDFLRGHTSRRHDSQVAHSSANTARGTGGPAAGTRWCSCHLPMDVRADCPRTCLPASSSANGDALGRPVGVAIDRAGALLVADDVGNVIWRVTPTRGGQIAAQPGFPLVTTEATR